MPVTVFSSPSIRGPSGVRKPPTPPLQHQVLTVDGWVITDTIRAADREGDDRTFPDSGYSFWPVLTNWLLNGGFEDKLGNALAGWSATNASLASGTTGKVFGSQRASVTCSANGDFSIWSNSGQAPYPPGGVIPLNLPIIAAPYFVVQPGSTLIGKTCRLILYEEGGATAEQSSWNDQTIIQGQNYLNHVRHAAQSDRTGARIEAKVLNGTAGESFQFDGAMIHDTAGLRAPYIETSGAQVTKQPGRVQVPAHRLDATTFCVAMRIRPEWGSYDTDLGIGNVLTLWYWGTSSTNGMRCQYSPNNTTGGQWQLFRASTTADSVGDLARTPFAAVTPHTIVCAGTATQIGISVDGAPMRWVAATNIPTGLPALWDIGQRSTDLTKPLNGEVLWAQAWIGATPSNDEVAALNSLGDSSPPALKIGGVEPSFYEDFSDDRWYSPPFGNTVLVVSASDAPTVAETTALTAVEGTTDAGSGADASALAAAETGADTGSGSEASALAAAEPGSDTGTGAETSALAAAAASSESETGADASALKTALPGSDTGAGTDASAQAAAAATSDTETGADTGSLTAATAGAETGAGLETSTLSASETTVESGGGTDTANLASALSGADASAETEAGSLVAALPVADQPTIAETLALLAAAAAMDTSSGADASALAAAVTDTDVAHAVETVAQLAAMLATDATAGMDTATLFAIITNADTALAGEDAILVSLIAVADTGSGVEATVLSTAVLADDLCGALDEASRTSEGAAQINAADEASASEQPFIIATVTSTEDAAVTDTGALTADFPSADASSSAETGEVGQVALAVGENITTTELAAILAQHFALDTAAAAELARAIQARVLPSIRTGHVLTPEAGHVEVSR